MISGYVVLTHGVSMTNGGGGVAGGRPFSLELVVGMNGRCKEDSIILLQCEALVFGARSELQWTSAGNDAIEMSRHCNLGVDVGELLRKVHL